MPDFRTIVDPLQTAIIFYFFIINSIYLLFTLISLQQLYAYSRSLHFSRPGTHVHRPISILVPAYNEEETIATNISSLLNLSYPIFEVIVINDGSEDSTLDKLIREFKLTPFEKVCRRTIDTRPVRQVFRSLIHPNLYVLDKENGLKADALNAGINYSQYPIFCSIDADSILEQDALMRASRFLTEDSTVVAVGGIVRVLNGAETKAGQVVRPRLPRRFIECVQVVEYLRAFLTGRTAWSAFGSLLIVSGAFSLLQKDAVLAIGGYRVTSIAEDMDLIIRLHRHGCEARVKQRVVFVPDPICWTQVPYNLASLLKQRNRWQRGLVETLWQNRRMFLRPRYGTVGMIGVPYFVAFEALGPIIEMFGYVMVITLYFFGELSPQFAVLYFLVAVLYGGLLSWGSILLENFLFRRYERARDLLKLSFLSIVEYFGFRQIVSLERVIGTFLPGRHEWGTQQRRTLMGEGDVHG